MINRKVFEFQARGRKIILGHKTCVMGIINVTSDSFSADGQLRNKDFIQSSVDRAIGMVKAGVEIIDIGGESTRPGASPVSVKEEIRRVLPVIEALISSRIGALISVDTSKAIVAKEALRAGVHIVNVVRGNAVSGLVLDSVRRFEAGIILMHMRGTPKTMQTRVIYKELISDIASELGISIRKAREAGIKRSHIIIDPGIGFAKVLQDNFLIIRELGSFQKFGYPVLVGPSKKSFIGNLLGLDVSQRSAGTIAAVTASVLQGAHIVRVHDCCEVKQAVSIADAVLSGGK